jgi:HNH endonuclease/NUMOD4 motif-containing protein
MEGEFQASSCLITRQERKNLTAPHRPRFVCSKFFVDPMVYTQCHTMWKPVPFNNRYEVHSQGMVRNRATGKILKATKTPGGYMVIRLAPSGFGEKAGQFFVHRLILLTFLGPPESPTMTCDHINRIRDDNRFENLRWATAAEQSGNRCENSDWKIHGTKLLQTSLSGEIVAQFASVSEASRRFKVKRDTIYGWIASKKVLTFQSMATVLSNKPESTDETEEWKTIELDGSALRVSNMGRVNNTRITKGSLNASGYVSFGFKGKNLYIHRLVAEAFLEGKVAGSVVHHKDSDRSNNKVSNLQWVTPRENSQKCVDEGKLGKYRRRIARCDDSGEVLQIYESVTAASKAMGLKKPTMLHNAVRRGYRCVGYNWKLLEKGVQSTTGGETDG